jgi:hypothetical protein
VTAIGLGQPTGKLWDEMQPDKWVNGWEDHSERYPADSDGIGQFDAIRVPKDFDVGPRLPLILVAEGIVP